MWCGCSLLKNALKHERLMIGQTYEPSKEGPEHDDMEAEVRLSFASPRLSLLARPSHTSLLRRWRPRKSPPTPNTAARSVVPVVSPGAHR